MSRQKLTASRKVKGLLKLVKSKVQKRPFLAILEITNYCNARCDFCDYWKTKKYPVLDDYVDVVRKIDPMLLNISGGEPLLRKDITQLIRRIHENMWFVYITLITHGQLLTLKKAKELRDAGVDQFSISMNFLGEAHDRDRGIPGLFDHLSKLIPKLPRAGIDNVLLNTVIMDENLEIVPQLIRQAYEWGVKISLSSYASVKFSAETPLINGEASHMVPPERLEKLQNLVEKIKELKRSYQNVVSSDFYLSKIPTFFTRGSIPNCKAGQNSILIKPDGYLKACPVMPVRQHYSDYKPWKEQVTCTKCWWACRGELVAPLSLERFKRVLL